MNRLSYVLLVLIGMQFISCKQSKKAEENLPAIQQQVYENEILSSDFSKIVGKDSIQLYTIINKNGIKADFTNYGQRLIALHVPDKNGKMEDVVLGLPTLDDYMNGPKNNFGAVIGRYGNRIAKGKFSIEGKDYQLAINNGENHLHGGLIGFESVIWKGEMLASNSVKFQRVSPHMEEGYPGNLDVTVTYTLSDSNELKIVYEANTDQTTVVNLTNHSYFNLKGEGKGDVNDHVMFINAAYYTPVDAGLIPIGTLESVDGTPLDFQEPKVLKDGLDSQHEQIILGGGYDHNFVLNKTPTNKEGLVLAARVEEVQSGRIMEVYTSKPGMQLYGGNFLNGSISGKNGLPYEKNGAFCLETQYFPDSPNQPEFPSTLLQPGETYKSTTVYKFDVSE